MITDQRDIDYSKYHTFFLEYCKFQDGIRFHLLRPSIATYEEVTSASGSTYVLDAAIVSFDIKTSLSQALLECSMLGISVDFIYILVPNEKTVHPWQENKIFQIIDTHKEDISKYVESVDQPRFYVTTNIKKSDVLKFLVIDRISQDSKVDFLKGKYDKNAVIAGFKKRKDAYEMCKRLIESRKA